MNQKKYLVTAVLFSTMSFLFAQNETQEAENQIKKSTEALIAKNFMDASNALQKAKEEVTKLLNSQLISSLPVKFENWIPVSDANTNVPMGMAGPNEISATKSYELEQKAEAKTELKGAAIIKTDSMQTLKAAPAMPPGVPTGTTGNLPGMPPGILPGMNMGSMGMNYGTPKIIVTISNNVSVASNIASINSGSNNGPMMASPEFPGEETKAIKIKNYRAMSKYNKMMKSGEVGVIIGAGVVQIHGTNIENTDVLQKFADQIDYQKIKSVFGE